MNTALLTKVAEAFAKQPDSYSDIELLSRHPKPDGSFVIKADVLGWALALDAGLTLEQAWEALEAVLSAEPGNKALALALQMALFSRDTLGLKDEQGQRLHIVSQWPEQFKKRDRSGKWKTNGKLAAKRVEYFIQTNGNDSFCHN